MDNNLPVQKFKSLFNFKNTAKKTIDFLVSIVKLFFIKELLSEY